MKSLQVIKETFYKDKHSIKPQVKEGAQKPEILVVLSPKDVKFIRDAENILRDKQYKNGYRRIINHKDTVLSLIDRRVDLDSISLSEYETQGSTISLTLDMNLYKALEGEAKKHSLPLREYVRGVLYSTAKKIYEDHREEQLNIHKTNMDNRKTYVDLFVTKEQREKYYKRHGRAIEENKLVDLIRADLIDYLDKK